MSNHDQERIDGMSSKEIEKLSAEMIEAHHRPQRERLQHLNTLQDVAELISRSNNIVVLTGAGISTSCGIPDFRSKDGIYSKFDYRKFGLGDSQELFDITVFKEDPSIFYSFASELLPKKEQYSPTHAFISLLQSKGKLRRNYTQNIDNIEITAGITPDRLVQCHGSIGFAKCMDCGFQAMLNDIKSNILKGDVPLCHSCVTSTTDFAHDSAHRKRKKQKKGPSFSSDPDNDDSAPMNARSRGVLKPGLTFFGEPLDDKFRVTLFEENDINESDMLLCIGTSLKVAPVSGIVDVLPPTTPQIYIGRERVRNANFDVSIFAEACDSVCYVLARLLGWESEFLALCDPQVSKCYEGAFETLKKAKQYSVINNPDCEGGLQLIFDSQSVDTSAQVNIKSASAIDSTAAITIATAATTTTRTTSATTATSG